MGNHSRGERGFAKVNGRDYNGRFHSDKPVTLAERIAQAELTVREWTAKRDAAATTGKATLAYFQTMVDDKTKALNLLRDEQNLADWREKRDRLNSAPRLSPEVTIPAKPRNHERTFVLAAFVFIVALCVWQAVQNSVDPIPLPTVNDVSAPGYDHATETLWGGR